MNKNRTLHIGHDTNHECRVKASSGGLGTLLQRYLLSTNKYGTSITFRFNKEKCMYEPQMIYRKEDVNNCGSIYQDINLANFVRKNIGNIKNGIVLTCPPCQVSVIRQMLDKASIPNFIISFCCSGQMTIEGTWKYYELLGINKEDVENMQYRGNGWPSGIQILLKNGERIYKDNWTEPWVTLHSAGFYRPKRCYYCKFDTSYKSDISLSDPWLDKYLNEDTIGNTLFIVNTSQGQSVLNDISEKGLFEYVDTDYNSYYTAQKPNVEKANRILNQEKYLKRITRLIENPWIRAFFTKDVQRMRLFIKLRQRVQDTSYIANIKKLDMGIVRKIISKWRYLLFSRRVGSHDGPFTVAGGVIACKPECLHFGKNVFIGTNTLLNAVTFSNGIRYNPIIKIGEGTSIGKYCTLSAINKVEIGKNVLFAAHVHITDHSHGYEDISRPIAPQTLITKGPVVIEDDCWLGYSCEILSGVRIGKHSIVGARAVVTKDVPSYSIVVGNPARIVKQYDFKTQKWQNVRK